jgi:glycosyltransferase involved in cell wall biosynthesis
MAAGLLAAVACIRKRKCDLIHAHWVVPAGLIALLAGGICRKPVVVTAHGSDILVTPRNNPLIRRLVRFVLRRADAVTSVAQHVTAEIVQMGIPRDKIVTFPMSVATESFSFEGPAAEGRSREKVIFSNRSLYPIYDVESLVRATPMILEKVPEAKVLIAGEGPEADRLASLARTLGVAGQVEFLGTIPHEKMPEYLRAASVYVSTALSDGASVSLLEAMACGTFPVVADIPANREWIEDGGNGFLFPPGDEEFLAEKIGECFDQDALRATAGEANIRLIKERAQWSLNVDKLLGLYEKVMTRS